jgi:pyruvate formate lyase activating enzyme
VDGPGNRFVVFLQGCNFDCLACHNPHTIPRRTSDTRTVTVGRLLDEIREHAPFLSGVTVSGGEPTLQAGFVADLFSAVGADADLPGLTRFLDTNGAAPPEVWTALLPHVDGVMVDLKALDPEVHRRLTGRSNDRVLSSIRRLAGAGRLYEVRLLLVAGQNDDPDMLARTGAWLGEIDPDLRVIVIGYRPHGVRRGPLPLRAPGPDALATSVGVLRGVGLHDVHVRG